jgi:hypothetical protein
MWLSIFCNCRLKKCPENGILKEIKELRRSLSLLESFRERWARGVLQIDQYRWPIVASPPFCFPLVVCFFLLCEGSACFMACLFDLFACWEPVHTDVYWTKHILCGLRKACSSMYALPLMLLPCWLTQIWTNQLHKKRREATRRQYWCYDIVSKNYVLN